jgi:O-antigen/teichoic acid export membrane protein
VDLFIVGYYLSLKEVGIYSVALFSAEMITRVPYWAAGILTPVVASNEEGNVKKTVYMFYASIIVAIGLGILIISVLLFLPGLIPKMTGKDFQGAEILIFLLLPRVVMQSGVGILAGNLAGKGYPFWHPLGTITGLILLVPLDMILIPRLGITGAPIGNSLAFVSTFVIFVIGFKKHNEMDGTGFKEFVTYAIRKIESLIGRK